MSSGHHAQKKAPSGAFFDGQWIRSVEVPGVLATAHRFNGGVALCAGGDERQVTFDVVGSFVQLNDNSGAVSVDRVVTKVGNFNVAVDLDVWGAHREVGDGEGGLVAFFTGDRLFTTCECGSAGNQAEGEENVLHGHDLEARK